MGRLLLVRHGQASFGAEDYDVLSALGRTQAGLLGAHLAGQGVVPDVVVHGSMRRQRDTAAELVDVAGWPLTPVVDARWDELDHLQVLAAYGGAPTSQDRVSQDPAADRRAFQAAYEHATRRWSAGETPDAGTGHTGAHPETGPAGLESYAAFLDRVRAARDEAVARAGPGATVVVVSSGGVIGAVAALLLGADGAALPVVWSRLNAVLVNASFSSVVVGGTGARLLTYNEHPHVSGETLTYR